MLNIGCSGINNGIICVEMQLTVIQFSSVFRVRVFRLDATCCGREAVELVRLKIFTPFELAMDIK